MRLRFDVRQPSPRIIIQTACNELDRTFVFWWSPKSFRALKIAYTFYNFLDFRERGRVGATRVREREGECNILSLLCSLNSDYSTKLDSRKRTGYFLTRYICRSFT